MTNQEIFDRVATHLLTQGVKAFDRRSGICRYRAHDGDRVLMCAAGCLMPDERYEGDFEGHSLAEEPLDEEKADLHCRLWTALGVAPEGRALVIELQNIHDNQPVEYWRDFLRHIASDFALSDAALDSDNLRAFVSRRASRVGAGE